MTSPHPIRRPRPPTPSLCIARTSTLSSPRPEQAGATIREPVQTFFTGDRFASIVDPFGQRWTVMTRVENVTPEERDRGMAEWSKENIAG